MTLSIFDYSYLIALGGGGGRFLADDYLNVQTHIEKFPVTVGTGPLVKPLRKQSRTPGDNLPEGKSAEQTKIQTEGTTRG